MSENTANIISSLQRNKDSAMKKLIRANQRGTGLHWNDAEVEAMGQLLSNQMAGYDEKGNPYDDDDLDIFA